VSVTYIQGSYLYPIEYNCEWIRCLTKLDHLSIHSSHLIEPRHRPIPQNQLYYSFAEPEQIADHRSLCRKSLKISFLPPDGLFFRTGPTGQTPYQILVLTRMRAVLLTGSLSSHRIASSIDGSLASSFNSKLLGDTMAAVRVQNIT
jgi:hypothetical protein